MKRSAIQACLAHPCCMAIFFGYKTAEHLLNSAGAPEFRPSVETPDRCGFVDAHALSSIDWTMFELPADEPLDIMVPSRNDRTRRKGFACHLATSDLPHGAYLEMMPDVFVASPALCLLQRCSDLTYAGRIKLVARFCGTYAPSKRSLRGFINRMPLATPEALRSFIELVPLMRGSKLALQAIDLALPNAASPMETEMVMPFYLPWQRGGFNLPRPAMNYEMTLSDRGRAMAGKEVVKVDAYWEDAGFGFEYQSELFHEGDEHYGDDIGRQLAIESMGKTIRMVTLAQLKNSAQLEYLAELTACHLGVGLHPGRGKLARSGLIRDILSD